MIMADAIQTAIASLQNVVASNNGPMASLGTAVQTMQAAGNNAVASIGPAIDKYSGANPQAMGLTHQAWQLNGALAAVNSGPSATPDDVSNAAAVVQQMIALYSQAYALAKSLQPSAAQGLLSAFGLSEQDAIATGGGLALGLFIIGGPVGAILGGGLGLYVSKHLKVV